jgi:putative DNA topoisomerase
LTKATLFSHKNDECCPKCGGELVIRSGAHGPFQGCSHYPECDYIRPLKAGGDGHIVKVLDGQHCPECQATLVLRQGKYGMFIGCSDYPMCHYIASINQSDETSIVCPQCQKGKLIQRKSRFGKVFYACDGYPACQFVINNTPVSGVCAYCGYPLLMEKRTSQGVKIVCASKSCGQEVQKQ